jgi:peptidoglycan-associated lipoprotein
MGLHKLASRKTLYAILFALALSLFAVGCKKKVPPPAPPPPAPKVEAPKPPPAKPTVNSFEAEPTTIERGQAATLRWNVTGEGANVSIAPGVGSVPVTGSRQVFPTNTTTYTLTAQNEGGTTTMTATVNVTAPAPPPPPPAPKPSRTISEALSSDVQDALFDYDSATIREDARAVLTRNADALKAIFNEFSNTTIIVEGHADERGSAEYNLGLADRRSAAAKEYLVQLGVSGDRLKTVSYGKERPQCTDANETCWQKNRRAHFSAGQ